jgi:hypothetical protein
MTCSRCREGAPGKSVRKIAGARVEAFQGRRAAKEGRQWGLLDPDISQPKRWFFCNLRLAYGVPLTGRTDDRLVYTLETRGFP